MSIPNKQIGWSNESNLLWQIAKQLERLTGVTSKISGGGGSSATVVTKAQVDALIASNSLVPGSTYIITGVDVPLYGGTTIMLQAETTNKLTLAGHGIFYNPKYLNSELTPNNGYGIWSNYISLTFSNIVGTFNYGDTVTANNGATAIYFVNGLLQWVSGDWSTATSVDNGAGATADIVGGVSPSYAIGQDVIWGGKHWTNTSGNVGSSIDMYTLSAADWTVVPFNSTDYNVAIDIIHYDYEHDMIVRRKDKWNNDVDGNYELFFLSVDYGFGNPIKDFQWGNGPEDFNNSTAFIGVVGNYVKDSYLDCINFIGQQLSYNTLTQASYYYRNITDNYSYVTSNNIIGSQWPNDYFYTGVGDCIFVSTKFSANVVESESYLFDNYMSNIFFVSNKFSLSCSFGLNVFLGNPSSFGGSDFSRNKFEQQSSLSGCNFNQVTFRYNVITKNSSVDNNTFTFTNFEKNILTEGVFNSNTCNLSNIDANVIVYGAMISNVLNNNSNINTNNVINSAISSNTLNASNITGNDLSMSFINNNSIINSSDIGLNVLNSNSTINGNTLSLTCYIKWNTLSSEGNITNNSLSDSSSIVNNLILDSTISSNLLSTSAINKNQLYTSIFNFSLSGTLTTRVIQYVESRFVNATANIAAATIIFATTYPRQLFRNSAGTIRLGYYDNSDVFTTVNLNA